MRRGARLAACAAVTSLLAATPAAAQLHWDAALGVGASKRFLGGRPTAADDAGVGPAAQLSGHLALMPLFHVGAYVGHEISPLPGDRAARDVTSLGARLKLTLPWVRGRVGAWLFAGAGYAIVHARGYRTTLFVRQGEGAAAPREVDVLGAGGGMIEVPFGLGASLRLRKPWNLFVELGARPGLAHGGSAFEDPGPQARLDGLPAQNVQPSGVDRFAVALVAGAMIDL